MTAEIAILNKEAVALAADSAVTINYKNNQKIFSSAHKLFALSKYSPVGMMIYGSAQYMGIPWETIIKQYRRKLDKDKLKSVKEYADDFIKFLNGGNNYVPTIMEDEYFAQSVWAYYMYIVRKINNRIEIALIKKEELTPEEITQIVKETIGKIFDEWKDAKPITGLPKNFSQKLRDKHKKTIKNIREKVFQRLPIGSAESNRLNAMALYLFTKIIHHMSSSDRSGIVVAGFGEDDIFPALYSYYIDGYVNKKLIYVEGFESEIGLTTTASIYPFAQHEMVNTFMEGINPQYDEKINEDLTKLITDYTSVIIDTIAGGADGKAKRKLSKILFKSSQKMLEEFLGDLNKYKKEEFSDPVLAVVAVLPRDELASMAESLIKLTSFKRRVSMDDETVAGAIDVAVISKSDGFVWINRKRYFDKELNPRFFANYNRR